MADGSDGLYIIKFPMNASGIEENKLPNKVFNNNYYIKYNLSRIGIYFGLKDGGEFYILILKPS